MPAQDRDPGVEGGVRDRSVVAREDRGERHPHPLGERDEVVHRDATSAERRGRPTRPTLGPGPGRPRRPRGPRARDSRRCRGAGDGARPRRGVRASWDRPRRPPRAHAPQGARAPRGMRSAAAGEPAVMSVVGRPRAGWAHGAKSSSGLVAAGTIGPMPDRDPGEVPPRRLLAHAPSERFAAARPAEGARPARALARRRAAPERRSSSASSPHRSARWSTWRSR